MTNEEVSHMSISALKSVLYQNHVNVHLLLEKSDLVARVHALLGDERQERAREAAIHAREEEEIIARQHAMEDQRLRDEHSREQREWTHMDSAHVSGDDNEQPKSKVFTPPPILGTAADLERNGLCVVCQDEEANIAIVDCGCVTIPSPYLCLRNRRDFAAIWQCADIAQISSCPRRVNVHCVVPASSRKLVFSVSSSHNAILLCFASSIVPSFLRAIAILLAFCTCIPLSVVIIYPGLAFALWSSPGPLFTTRDQSFWYCLA
jgi:hypothetical protein